MEKQVATSSGSGKASESNIIDCQTTSKEVQQAEEVEWPCLFCSKTFKTSQGLGGHQNAHRREKYSQMRANYPKYKASRRSISFTTSLPHPTFMPPPPRMHGLVEPCYPCRLSHGHVPVFGPGFGPNDTGAVGPWPHHGLHQNTTGYMGSMVVDGSGGPTAHMLNGAYYYPSYVDQVERKVGPSPCEDHLIDKYESVDSEVEVQSNMLDLDLRL